MPLHAVYETLVVHPAWSRKPPESFVGFVGAPISRMNIAAFWIPVAPLFALSAGGALGAAFLAGAQGPPLILSSAERTRLHWGSSAGRAWAR